MRSANVEPKAALPLATALLFLLVLGLLLVASEAPAQLSEYALQSLAAGACCAISPEQDLYFGGAAAIGDFNGDGFAEIAVAASGATLTGGEKAGKVVVLRGTANGPTTASPAVLDETALGGTPEVSDYFGWALAAGDFNADGAADLAIGVPGDNPDAINSAGGVYVAYGAPGGGALFGDEVEYWSYATVVLGGFAHAGDAFGRSLAVGDFDGDGDDDLAIGAPLDNVFVPNSQAGSLTLLRGGAFGLSPSGGLTLHRNSAGVPGTVADFDQFGAALAAGDFDGDGDDELAIGAPGATIDGIPGLGEVVVLEFELDGGDLEIASSGTWSEGHGIPGAQEPSDGYGRALAVGDFDGDGADDLAIGAPEEGVGEAEGAGAVAMIYGSAAGGGLNAVASLRTQDDIAGQDLFDWEGFGTALAAGDFDHDGRDDLAIGAPRNRELLSVGGGFQWVENGAIHVVRGTAVGLGFSGAQTWRGNPAGDEQEYFGAVLTAGRLRGSADALFVGSTSWSAGGATNVGRGTVFHSVQIFADGFASSDTFLWSSTAP